MSFPGRGPQRAPGPQQGGGDLNSAEAALNHSELFRAECKRLLSDFDKTCKRMQDDEKQQLDQQVRKMQFVKEELELKLEQMILETDVLSALHSRGMKALNASKESLRVTNLCLEERRKSPVCERDAAQGELLKERQVTEGAASLLQKVLQQLTEQTRLNRSAKYYLEQDLKELSTAQGVDYSLMNSRYTNNLQMSEHNNAGQPSVAVTPEQSENVSYMNLAKAEQQQSSSVSLRALVESVLEQTAADMHKQFQATTAAIQQNAQDMKVAKSQVEDKLPKILSEIMSQQSIREDLQVAVRENEHRLSLVQDRLRPGREHDAAESRLLAELKQLTTHIHKLQEGLVQSQEKERELLRCQLQLQENIHTKDTCLYIDSVVCMQHRDLITIQNF
ncbi:tektin-1-like [Cololabis saira]|uniref:tektin-1-like n=1 Tax=Cololabis saira TaxID=129043 RepID=UPI002AD2040B|nr:tektin-1-like [Cololabis saira]